MLSRFLWWLYMGATRRGWAYRGRVQWWIADVLNILAWYAGPAPWWNDDARKLWRAERGR